ncbi:MAG: FkbM family methyltransferase [Paracoccaceae bacterium]
MNYVLLKLRQLRRYLALYGPVGIAHFFSWNLRQIRGKPDETYPIVLPNGHCIRVRSRTDDLSTFHQVWIGEQYALETMHFWNVVAARRDAIRARGARPLIIDGGANVGLSMLYFKSMFPEGRVVGIEAEAGNHRLAAANVAGVDGLEVVHAGLSDAEGTLTLSGRPRATAGFRVGPDGADGGVEIPAVTVDGVLAEHGGPEELLLVKLDIEGSEHRALYAATEAQRSGAPFVIEPHDTRPGVSGSLDGLETFVTTWSFDFVTRGENVYFVPRRRKSTADATARYEVSAPRPVAPTE